MSGKASTLVAQAKQWATYYGDYPNGAEGAVLSVPLRIRGEWERNDADALAAIFTENGSMLVGDVQLHGREEIRAYLAEAFAGGYGGSRLTEETNEIRFLTDDVALAITQGGILRKGADELSPDEVVRAMYVIVKQEGEWKLASHQTSPIKG
ncbi:SgcJ/EcaC family oxidoreductase [Amycolatopsis sp. H20-H5]|uniref:SgcJ/EcaC family oxidoreductase n=1 Tax=Amycolatopsis sp. H20-H5 TaxID=3046309 RepID=UPI002DB6211F|nr:SgcJ/EcaC family oxidoreductase [Amycolatopsis sp. H20-H5]MEC3975174.1 SgcJ/EcaC family oxidoreductase [Amycolatopsis sp. H20-H5]